MESLIAALGDVRRVAESEHEFVADFGVLSEAETEFLDAGREAEVGEGWCYDVERRLIFNLVGLRGWGVVS